MKLIPLTQGQFAIVDDEDFERLSQLKWYAAKKRQTFYAQREHSNTCLKMHRFILGVCDRAVLVDHKNGNGLDNRRENLRLCSNAENTRNRLGTPNTSSKYKGVSWCNNTMKWKAQIRKNGVLFYLGVFQKEADAAFAYNKKSSEIFGEFSKLNEI